MNRLEERRASSEHFRGASQLNSEIKSETVYVHLFDPVAHAVENEAEASWMRNINGVSTTGEVLVVFASFVHQDNVFCTPNFV